MDLSKVGEDILRKPAGPVGSAREAREIIAALESEFMLHPDCLGLAAVQIGIPKAVGIIRKRSSGLAIDLINPRLVRFEDPFVYEGEGCMSFPCRRFSTARYRKIFIENDLIWMPPESQSNNPPPHKPKLVDGDPLYRAAFAYSWNQPEDLHGGRVCIAVQHEIDHLNGICLPWADGSVETPYTEEGARSGAKVGRNDPCPCGSGRKYKKCCLDKSFTPAAP